MGRNTIFSIAPHAPFLPTLVARILDGTLPGMGADASAFGLADLTIIVPTSRARAALADAFLAQSNGSVLLPDIRTFGEQPEDEEPFLPPFEAAALPPAIGVLSSRVILAQLVQRWIETQEKMPFSQANGAGFASPPSPAEILALADSLADLISECHTEGISIAQIKTLVPDDLAGNWQQSLSFLSLVLEVWPAMLAERGEVDASAQRNLRLARQAAAARFVYGDRPVIAAGSTGSIPATASLLKAIADLPNGALVLPGVDTTIRADGHLDLTNAKNAPHGHPQFGMAQLLTRLNATHTIVHELAPPDGADRTQVLRRALALPKDTANWSALRVDDADATLEAACDGVSICVARTQEEEARAIALAARQALQDRQTVAIVSPDRNLTRRIAAELARFDVIVDDSAGAPLFQSRIGRLARQVLAVAASALAPIDLIALLHNRFVTLGRARSDIAHLTDLLEMAVLRGQRPAPGMAGLIDTIKANCAGNLTHARHRLSENEAQDLTTLITDLDAILAPLAALNQQAGIDTATVAAILNQTLDAVMAASDGSASTPEGYDSFKQWVGQMQTLSGLGPRFAGRELVSIVQGLMAGFSVRSPSAGRNDIAMFGLLEARLQNADLMILAGLNEGIWPQPADPGPWLSRNMRLAAGLQPPERQQGQMAHDFEMAMGNKNVLISFAERVGTSPALPSRLVQRFEAYLGEQRAKVLRAKGRQWTDQARRIDFVGKAQAALRPMPYPPAAIRPRALSVTEIETLIRSPYDLYAKHILKLKRLDALGDDPDIRERGTLVHDILATFVARGEDPTAPDAYDRLMAIADEVFVTLETVRERRAVWRRRLQKQAQGYLDFERSRHADIAGRHVERDGQWQFDIAGEKFTLRGRADRLDQMKNGTLEIIDYKTGSVPKPVEMKDYVAPQLLVEAAIAHNGSFDGVASAPVSALTYIKLAAGPQAFELTQFALRDGMDIAGATDELITRINRHVEAFLLRDNLPMTARIVPKPGQTYAGDYDHLSRMHEWTEIDGEEEGE